MDDAQKQLRRAKLQALIEKYHEAMKGDGLLFSERDVIEQFIRPFLGDVLGFPVDDPTRYRTEVRTSTGRPDIVVYPDNGQNIFIEAKRFGRISKLSIARKQLNAVKPHQLWLPGMAKDRIYEEQQAINYAFETGGKWAILTNFETLRLFNARRDWLILSFDGPDTYIQDFDFLMKLSYEAILEGSLDELDGTRYRLDIDEDYLAFINEWREKLGRDLLQNRAKNTWLFTDNKADANMLREVVQRFIDRLVVIRFAEDHFVIPPTLEGIFNLGQTNIYVILQNILHDFFSEFDKHHNSALFAQHLTDQAHFSQKTILDFLGFLNNARYRAMPADILGNTYEQYLGKRLTIEDGDIFTRDNLETRKKQGSYYTPQPMVQFLVDRTLGRYLYATQDGTPDGIPLPDQTRKTSSDIIDLTIIDCASGSGSFLIYAYQVLATFYQAEIKRLEALYESRSLELHQQQLSKVDIQLELIPIKAELERIRQYPRLILEKHIYGVDLDPQAAEVAVVNLMMRALEGQTKNATHADKRLPLLLNQNIKVGNGLVGVLPHEIAPEHHATIAQLIALRAELLTLGHGARHDAVVTEIEALTAALRGHYHQTFAPHFADLPRANPFHWGVEFPEVFFNADGTPKPDGGFTIIIGNPPWEIVKPDLREFYAQYDPKIEHGYKRAQVEKIIADLNHQHPEYLAEYTASTHHIEQTAAYIRQSPHFTHQGKGDPATHKMFVERAWSLLRPDGFLGYVVPSGIYSDLGTKELRQMLFDHGRVIVMAGLSNVRGAFPSIDSRFKFTLFAVQKGGKTTSFPVTFRIGYEDYPPLRDDFDRDDVLRAVLYDKQAYFEMTIPTIKRFSPDTLSLMEFKSADAYRRADKLYANHPRLGDILEGIWNLKFAREFDMTNDRHLFEESEIDSTGAKRLPLYEGKMIHQFDAFFAQPQYWVDEKRGAERLKNKTGTGYREYRLAFRDIAASTNERTLISTILPKNVFANNKVPLIYISDSPNNHQTMLYVCGVLNSYVMDFLIRQKVSTSLNFFYMYTLPMPRIDETHPLFKPIVGRVAQLVCTRPEFDDLWASLGDWVSDLPRATEAPLREVVRAELDALVAHLYGLAHFEYDALLRTFPLVFPNTPEGNTAREKYAGMYVSMKNRLGL